MDKITDNKSLLEQYKNDTNLNTRINIYKYQKKNIDFNSWCFNSLPITGNSNILELGCGNGVFWNNRISDVPETVEITLSDFSQGMLESAKKNLNKYSNRFRYEVVDIQNILYEENSFDIVLAKHMLFHIPNLNKALSEVKRILKPKGVFISTTNSKYHFAELEELVHNFDSNIEYYPSKYAEAFGMETGEEKLNKYFRNVRKKELRDKIVLKQVEPVINYLLSTNGNAKDILADKKLKDFEQYLKGIIIDRGNIEITTHAGIFIAEK